MFEIPYRMRIKKEQQFDYELSLEKGKLFQLLKRNTECEALNATGNSPCEGNKRL